MKISLASGKESVEIGNPIEFRLSYENQGNEAFFIERPGHSPSKGLKLIAQREECRYETPFLHASTPIEYHRFSYIPLFLGDRFVTALPQLSDLPGSKLMDLRVPGEYEFQAILRSEGPRVEGFIWPIWRGETASKPLSLTLESPSEETVTRWRRRLEDCAKQSPCVDLEAIGYFRFVRDPEAAKTLRELLRRDYEENPMIGEAVANQGSVADIELLKHVATMSTDASTEQYFEMLAQTRLDDPCRKLPSEQAQ